MQDNGSCVRTTVDSENEVKMLCGKSRVAPLKQVNRKEKEASPPEELTIRRLKICVAVLCS